MQSKTRQDASQSHATVLTKTCLIGHFYAQQFHGQLPY